MGEQLLMAKGGGGDGCGVVPWGETVSLWGESTRLRVKPGPAVVPASPGNELKKFGDATQTVKVSSVARMYICGLFTHITK